MIGIGITTRNRPNILYACLLHFAAFLPKDALFVIIDDTSKDWANNQAIVENFSNDHGNHCKVIYKYNQERLGISGSKNECLLALQDCEDVFLFDDDAWPQKENWDQIWLAAVRNHGIGHSLWATPVDFIKAIGIVGSGETELTIWNQCLGVCLHFNRACLNALGGYDARAKIYGYEHAQMSQRAHRAGFTRFNSYVSPSISSELIYSLDISYGWKKQQPLLIAWDEPLVSSVTQLEAQTGAKGNLHILDNPPIYIELKGTK